MGFLSRNNMIVGVINFLPLWELKCCDFGTKTCERISMELSRRFFALWNEEPRPLTLILSPEGRGDRRNDRRHEKANR